MTLSIDDDTLVVYNRTTGKEFRQWEEIRINSDFLGPCDDFSLTAGAEIAGVELAKQMAVGSFVELQINGKPVLTGYVDSTAVTVGRSGTRVVVSGRDVLGPVVDGNVDPRMQVPKQTDVAGLCQLVLVQQYGLGVVVIEDDGLIRQQLYGTKSSGKKYQAKHARTDPLKELQPKDNEGAFAYLGRILSHAGYWLWATGDGQNIVIAGPDYEATPSYALTRIFVPGGGGAAAGNNVMEGTATLDETNVPSQVWCRGVDATQGTKGSVLGMAENTLTSRFKPVYIADKQANTKKAAERIAATFLARMMRNFFTYKCTVAGFVDRTTGATWAVNTVAYVRDECCGVEGNMWIESRTFQQGRNGTTTQLKLIPLGTLLLDVPASAIPPFPKSYTDARTSAAPGTGSPLKTGNFTVGDVTFFGSKS